MSSDSPPTLETEECHKLLDTFSYSMTTHKKERQACRNLCMALLMLDAGLRVGEVVSLRLSDLYFNREPVRSIIIRLHMTKSKVEHSIPVSERLSAILKKFFTYVDTESLDEIEYSDFAFRSAKGVLTTRQVERIIRKAAEKSLGRPVNPHVLRHTAASRWMRVTNEAVVQQLLGHKYLSSTQIYCHPNEDDKRRAIVSASQTPDAVQSSEQPQQDQPASSNQAQQGLQTQFSPKPKHRSHW